VLAPLEALVQIRRTVPGSLKCSTPIHSARGLDVGFWARRRTDRLDCNESSKPQRRSVNCMPAVIISFTFRIRSLLVDLHRHLRAPGLHQHLFALQPGWPSHERPTATNAFPGRIYQDGVFSSQPAPSAVPALDSRPALGPSYARGRGGLRSIPATASAAPRGSALIQVSAHHKFMSTTFFCLGDAIATAGSRISVER
jgi:hypothetical protein